MTLFKLGALFQVRCFPNIQQHDPVMNAMVSIALGLVTLRSFPSDLISRRAHVGRITRMLHVIRSVRLIRSWADEEWIGRQWGVCLKSFFPYGGWLEPNGNGKRWKRMICKVMCYTYLY